MANPLFSDKTYRENWQRAAALLGLSVPTDALPRFEALYQAVLDFNAHTNLTRLTTPDAFGYRHILESLVLSRWIPENARVVDVGSGGGFPVLPLALFRPDAGFTAIESTGKKCAFISEAADTLGVKNLMVLHERSEAAGNSKDYRASFDIVTARAVAALPVLLELTIPLVKTGGRLLAVKGDNAFDELKASGNAMDCLHAELVDTFSLKEDVAELPYVTDTCLLMFEKMDTTPKTYPRKPGTPAKSPL